MLLRDSLRTVVYACLVGLLGLFASEANGQGIDNQQQQQQQQSFNMMSGFNLNPLQGMTQMQPMAQVIPMEGAVDASTYLVGPGDVFDVSIGGAQPVMVSIPVSADGHLLLLDAGTIDVAGKPLEEARRLAMQALQPEFQNVAVNVALSRPRHFYVHVSGAVPMPGRYVATPVARVATVLGMTYQNQDQQEERPPVGNPSMRPAMRNVMVRHRDGTADRIDLLKYYATGNTEHNPYLRDGDVVFVPTYHPENDAVLISGDVAFPGTYDHRPDDTLHGLLELATGEMDPDDFAHVRLLRTGTDGAASAEMYDMTSEKGLVTVSVRDQIHVVQDPTDRGTASVEGWVTYPGAYSIVTGETTLSSLLEMAGGPREGALLRGAYLQRAPASPPEPVVESGNRYEAPRPSFRPMRADSMLVLRNTRLGHLDYISRAYLAHELRLQSRVPIDLRNLGSVPTLRLQNGDKLIVPRDDNNVFVVGQVNRPGYVAYQSGASFAHYATEAGGLSENAGPSYVIEAGTGRYLSAETATIHSGDLIFVDRADALGDTDQLQQLLVQERQIDLNERSSVVQTVVSSVSAITAIITTYLFITRE